MPLSGFDASAFTHAGATFPVYRTGAGPGVVIIHEIPGITPQVARFARRVADAGFTVVLPELFGTAGRRLSVGYNRARGLVDRLVEDGVLGPMGETGSHPVLVVEDAGSEGEPPVA